jgi:hypothetical protein
MLLRNYILLNFDCRGLYRFCCCFKVALDSYNGLDDGAKIGGVLELGNQDAYSCDHGLDKRLRHRLVFGGVDTDKCFPKVIAEVCSMLTGVVRPCCHLRPRCRHGAYIALGNTHKLRLLSWPKGGLLDAVFDVQFQKLRSRCLWCFSPTPLREVPCVKKKSRVWPHSMSRVGLCRDAFRTRFETPP